MPTYNFRNKKTDETWSEFMKISEMEELIKNPDIEILPSAPAIGDPWHNAPKSTGSFNDVLKKIKSKHPHNNIETRNISEI